MERPAATENGLEYRGRSSEQASGKRSNNIQDRFVEHVSAPQRFSVIFPGKTRCLVMTQNKGYVISWPSWKMQPDPSPSSTSQKQKILRISELSPIYLPKSSHQENVCVEISPGYFPHKFHFLFILLTNSVFPTVSKLPLLFSYMFIDDFTLLVLYLF